MNGRYIITLLLTAFCGLMSASVQAGLQRYQASMAQSEWHVFSSPLRCELHHPVPRYGLGSFVYSAGGELAFIMNVLDPAVRDSVANIVSIAPFWKPLGNRDLGQLSLSRGDTPFYASRSMALRMLYELDAGRFPTLQYKDWADQTDDVSVALSSVNFHQVLPEFQRCIAELLPYGLDDLQDETVHFDHGESRLSKSARQQLDRMAVYAGLDDKLDILIKAHTDSKGGRRFNKRLSIQRAESVRKYFLKKGVSKQQLILETFGEAKPVATNRSAKGRAKNRRAEVTISHLQEDIYPLH